MLTLCQLDQQVHTSMKELEQLECLRSDDSPRCPMIPIVLIHIGSQVKTKQSQSYKFKNIAKTSIFDILQYTLHTTHLLKLPDKMCKYEMDPASIV